MSKQISGLSVGLTGNVSGFAKAFRSALGPVQALTGGLRAAGSGLASAGTSMLGLVATGGLLAVGMKGVDAVIGGIGKGFTLANDFEQASVAMETMLGSADAARKVLGDLTDFAASTPFEMPELVDSTKKLIAFGVEQKKLLPTLNAIGDVAAGVGVPINELSEIFGKAKVQGTLMAEDINQLTGRGIPIIGELAKQFGVAEGKVKTLVSEGKVGFANLERAFADMSASGGKFSGMMAKQSGTVGGMLSTLSDTVGLALMKVTQGLMTAFNFKAGLGQFTSALSKVGDVVVGWVAYVAPIVMGLASRVVAGFQAMYDRVAPVVAEVGRVAGNLLAPALPLIGQGIDLIGGLLTRATTWYRELMVSIFAPAVAAVRDNWQTILVSTVGYVQAVGNVVTAGWSVLTGIASAVWSGVVGVWNWGLGLVTSATGTAGLTMRGFWQNVVEVVNWMRDKVTLALNTVAFGVNHWRELVGLGLLTAELGVVRFANQVQYFFGDVIPTLLMWFGRNWKELLTDYFNFTNTLFKNLVLNVVGVIASLPDLIRGKINFEDVWRPLTDGFKSTLRELPQIAERQAGPMEQALERAQGAAAGKLAGGLADYLAAQKAQAQVTADAINKTWAAASAPPPTPPAVTKPPEVPTPPPLSLKAMVDPKAGLTVAVTPEIKPAKAIRSGSAESQALRYMLAYTAGGPGGPAVPAGVGGAGKPGPLSPAPLANAIAAAQPAATAGMKDVAAELAEKQLAALREQGKTLKSIETNTGRAAATPPTVTF